MKYGNVTLGQMEAILNKLGGEDGVAKFLRGENEAVATKVINFITHTFTVLVDETLTVEKAVKAGKFDWSNDKITSDIFPKLNGKELKKEISLFHFNKGISSRDEVIRKMRVVGFKPASIWDLLGLAVKEPNLQEEFPIVSLGSEGGSWGCDGMAFLDRDSVGRFLSLDTFSHGYRSDHRFAGVRR